MSVIIGSIIAIVVLTIVVFLLVENFKGANDATDCPSIGGICSSEDSCQEPIIVDGQHPTCKVSGEICCKLIQ